MNNETFDQEILTTINDLYSKNKGEPVRVSDVKFHFQYAHSTVSDLKFFRRFESLRKRDMLRVYDNGRVEYTVTVKR